MRSLRRACLASCEAASRSLSSAVTTSKIPSTNVHVNCPLLLMPAGPSCSSHAHTFQLLFIQCNLVALWQCELVHTARTAWKRRGGGLKVQTSRRSRRLAASSRRNRMLAMGCESYALDCLTVCLGTVTPSSSPLLTLLLALSSRCCSATWACTSAIVRPSRLDSPARSPFVLAPLFGPERQPRSAGAADNPYSARYCATHCTHQHHHTHTQGASS